jgi:hypothetical protein
MNNDKDLIERRKSLLNAFAPQGVQEAIGKIKKRLVQPKAGVDLVGLAQKLVKRHSTKK